MQILITNDDGWGSKGILTLIRAMRQLGDVTVVAPDGARSGQSNAITVQKPVRFKLLSKEPGLTVYTCTGTPTDCVKIAVHVLFPEQMPDLVCSGINHGDNGTINVIYSGTMGAVFEGCTHDILSIGWSICDHNPDADFSYLEPYITAITKRIISLPKHEWRCWNINAPVGPLKGARLTRHCHGYWTEEFKEYQDPVGQPFYMLTGRFVNTEPQAPDTDQAAYREGYISVCPVSLDMTDGEYLKRRELDLADL